MAELTRRLFLVADVDLPDSTIVTRHDMAAELATASQEPVCVIAVRAVAFGASLGHSENGNLAYTLGEATPAPPSGPMSSADFVHLEHGRPDWGAMWTDFSELALHGGPPHRGEDTALYAPENPPTRVDPQTEMIAEIRRGIWETTGLGPPCARSWRSLSRSTTSCRSRFPRGTKHDNN